MFPDFLNHSFFQNTVLNYLIAVAVLAGGVVAVRVLKFIVFRRLEAWAETTETTFDDFVILTLEKIGVPLLYFVVLYLAVHSLTLPPAVAKGMRLLASLVVTVSGIRCAIEIVHYALNEYWLARHKEPGQDQLVKGMLPIVKTMLWGLGLIFLLDNLGYKISTVITGLGIGGVAVALAAQAVLGDLFSYFSIMFDRPFTVGDFVVVDDFQGTIERIGIKTTRLRSINGEQLVFSNTNLTGSRIRNYKRMDRRRVVLKLGVTYETTLPHLREIPKVLKSLVEKVPGTAFERAHFSSYGDFSLNYEVVYHVLSGDYLRYMDAQQEISFAVHEEFGKRRIEFAYPTQTLYVNKPPLSS